MYRHEDVSTNDFPIKLVIHTKYIESQNVLRHWHQAVEIDYVVRGKAKFVISGQEYLVSSGDLLIINSNEIHSVSTIDVGEDTFSLTYLLPYEKLKHEIDNFDNYWFISPLESNVDTIKIKEDLFNYYQNSQRSVDHRNLILKSNYYQILFDLINNFGDLRKNHPNLPTLPTLHKLSNVVSYIDQFSDQKLTLPIIAQSVHLSEGYLSRTFSEQMGKSVMEYVNLIRLKKAFELVTNTDKNLEVISDMVGFANPKAFRRLFQKVYKTTPGKYRRECLQNKHLNH